MNDGTTNEQVVDTTDRVETISDLRMVKGTLVQATLNQAIRIAVNNAIEDAKMHFLPPSQDEVTEIEYRILDEVNRWISTVVADDGEKIQRLSYLPNAAIARLMIALEGIKALNYSDGNNAGNYQLGIYQDCGENEGIYVTTEDLFIKVIKKYNFNISVSGIRQVMELLRYTAPVVAVRKYRNLIPVNNGIFDYDTKKLLPFSPDYVFVSKCKVNFNAAATNVVIHNDDDGTDWDVDSWIHELTDDPQVEKLIWQIIGAVIRPNVRWDKVIMPYSTKGNNGKGTLCRLLRNLCGEGNYTSIAINDMSKNFRLSPLLHVSAVIVDENNVTGYLDDASTFKALITGDQVQIEEKYKAPVDFRFSGLMVQCVNFLPRVNDKTSSFYRRILMVPFEKCFTGAERKYIKDDYLNRQEVLEYVLYKVLEVIPSYYDFDVPDACTRLLDDYKTFNDPVRQFAEEMLPELKWQLVPNKFLYDLFKAWYEENIPSGRVQGKNSFLQEFKDVIAERDDWKATGSSVPTQGYSFGSEPLIIRYNLTKWMNDAYRGTDAAMICTPSMDTIKSSVSGIIRTTNVVAVEEDEDKPFSDKEESV
ncbi:MAG TPA: DNA primase [Lachnospiraceae bacterium]|nr:DNA primase [Lachnospiraceae bacterium]